MTEKWRKCIFVPCSFHLDEMKHILQPLQTQNILVLYTLTCKQTIIKYVMPKDELRRKTIAYMYVRGKICVAAFF